MRKSNRRGDESGRSFPGWWKNDRGLVDISSVWFADSLVEGPSPRLRKETDRSNNDGRRAEASNTREVEAVITAPKAKGE